jgi:hypothetical protein
MFVSVWCLFARDNNRVSSECVLKTAFKSALKYGGIIQSFQAFTNPWRILKFVQGSVEQAPQMHLPLIDIQEPRQGSAFHRWQAIPIGTDDLNPQVKRQNLHRIFLPIGLITFTASKVPSFKQNYNPVCVRKYFLKSSLSRGRFFEKWVEA